MGYTEMGSDAELENADGIAAHRAVGYAEVERVVCAHPDVLEAAAVGVRALDGASAEDEILVCIVARDDRSPDVLGLLAFCDERMPYFAVPRYVELLGELPKTPTAKVQKAKLRERGIGPEVWDRVKAGLKLKDELRKAERRRK